MRSIKELQEKHIVYELDSFDRVLLKIRTPSLSSFGSIAYFLREHFGCPIPNHYAFLPVRDHFISAIDTFAKKNGIDKIEHFSLKDKNGGKEARVRGYLQEIEQEQGPLEEGIVHIGKAQENTYCIHSSWKERLCSLSFRKKMVNWYYVYFMDKDFGLCFLKICSYAPFNMFLYFNGHEYVKRRLKQKGIGFEELENGLLSCEDPITAQRVANELKNANKIEKLTNKWVAKIPNPIRYLRQYHGAGTATGIHQVEYARTQVWDKPVHGREFFEQVIKENLSLGKPDSCGAIFNKQHRKNGKQKTFSSKVYHYGVIPVFIIWMLSNKLKQYFKGGKAHRIELTINNTRDFGIGKTLTRENWNAVWGKSEEVIERTLEIEKLSHDPSLGKDELEKLETPAEVGGQRISALPRGKQRTRTVFKALTKLDLTMGEFRNRDLRQITAELEGKEKEEIGSGRISYELRKLKGHELIEKEKGKNAYKLTKKGRHVVLYSSRMEEVIYGDGLSGMLCKQEPVNADVIKLRKAFEESERMAIEYFKKKKLAA